MRSQRWPGPAADTNSLIASLLRDLAAVQKSTQSRWGYKRAAAAILDLDEPIESPPAPDGTLPKIPNIGPSSLRVVIEALDTGGHRPSSRRSRRAGRRTEIEKSRALRGNFLSRAQVVAALSEPAPARAAAGDYRGDLQMHSVWSDGPDARDDDRGRASRAATATAP